MAAGGAVGGNHVEVEAGLVEVRGVVGEEEPDHGAFEPVGVELAFRLGKDLGQRLVGRILVHDGAEVDRGEHPVDANGVRTLVVVEVGENFGLEFRPGHRPVEVEPFGLTERDERREWDSGVGRCAHGNPVRVDVPELAVDDDEFAVETGERAETEIATTVEFPDGHIPVVAPVQQRLDGLDLENFSADVVEVGDVPETHPLHSERMGEAEVKAHGRTFPHRTGTPHAPHPAHSPSVWGFPTGRETARPLPMTTVVSIHSFRGGTGKSNTTANVAAQLALAGNKVAVVDTDIQSPGIHVLFGFDEDGVTTSLNDYLHGTCTITEAAYDVTDQVGATDGKLWLVPSSIKASEIARVLREGYDVGLLNDGFRELGTGLGLDYLLIDTHPGLNEETLLSITISDILLLLMRPDKQDFQGTAVTVDVARRLEVPSLFLVINKVPASVDHDALRADVSRIYDADVAGVLPLSETVVESASGALFSITQPEDPWSQAIVEVARRVGA